MKARLLFTLIMVPTMFWGRGLKIFGGYLSTMSWDSGPWEVKMPSLMPLYPACGQDCSVASEREPCSHRTRVRECVPSFGRLSLYSPYKYLHTQECSISWLYLGDHFLSFQHSWICLNFASFGHLEAPLGTSHEIQMCNCGDCAYKLDILIFAFKAGMMNSKIHANNLQLSFLLTLNSK